MGLGIAPLENTLIADIGDCLGGATEKKRRICPAHREGNGWETQSEALHHRLS